MRFHHYIFLLLLSVFTLKTLSAEEISVGVLDFPEVPSITDPQSPVELLLVGLLSEPLVRQRVALESGESRIEFRLADQISPLRGGKAWAIRLRSEDLRFHNQQKLRAADVVASLQRCKAVAGELDSLVIEDRLRLRVELRRVQEDFPLLLSGCPIFPATLLERLDDFGSGTSAIGTGAYWMRELRPGRVVELRRFPAYFREGRRPNRLEIRKIRDTMQGLQGLRAGTLVAVLLAESDDMVERAVAEDPTLALSHCSFGVVVHRRNFSWQCSPHLEVTELRYVL